MNITCRKIGFVNVVAPNFPLIDDNINEFKKKLKELLLSGENKLVIDFSKIVLISSEGIEVLMDFYEDTREKYGGLKLCRLNDLCTDIFIATRLNNLFDIFKEPEDAARSFL